MQLFRTLRGRFALWIAGLLLFMLAAFGAFVYLSLRQGLLSAVDTSLQLSATQAIAAVNIENNQINFNDSLPESSALADLRSSGYSIRIIDLSGAVRQSLGPYGGLPVQAASLAAARGGLASFATLVDPALGARVRLYTAPIVDNNQVIAFIEVAQSLTGVQNTLNRLLAALLIGGGLLIVVAGLGGYWLAGRALAPIDHITQTARRISAEDLSARLNLPAVDDEVGRLAATFDAMLGRLDESFRRQRQFTADASHELRTPLAAMQAILSVMRTEKRTAEDYEQALADLSDETDRLRGLVEALLRLAHSDTEPASADEWVDLSALLRDVCESLRPLAEAKGLALQCAIPAGLDLRGDGDSLIRLFVNLLDNAIAYTERGQVILSAGARGQQMQVAVSDTGLGIAPEHLPHIFDRFYRGDRSRTTAGTGLGLAIALEIARAHGGTIEASSSVGLGTTFTVRLGQMAGPSAGA